MKVIIAGSRTINDYSLLEKVIKDSEFAINEVICGNAKGVDKLGEQWAKRHNMPIKYFEPEWDLYGKAAGVMRNQEMVDYADALIAIQEKKSKGTEDIIRRARHDNIKLYVFNYREDQTVLW